MPSKPARRLLPHLSHWGAFGVRVEGGAIVGVEGHRDDPEPSPLLRNIASAAHHPSRVAQPLVRRGWLERGPGPDDRRGADEFVALPWTEALDLLARELERVRTRFGNAAIFGGSYGWASAGRFHHSQSQLHRFLNCIGGYTRSVNSYSIGASEVLLPHVVGSLGEVRLRATTWKAILEHTELIVAFGGMALKNSSVSPGGVTRHTLRGNQREAARRGLRVELFSPLRDDLAPELNASWHAIVPGTDTAVMLALAHTLVTENLHDRAFLARYTTGFERFREYLVGDKDGVPKDAEWAERISSIAASEIRALARRMAAARTLVTVSWSLQRARHGEQPVWMGIALSALLGQIGLPGGGFGHGYGSMADVGAPTVSLRLPFLPQGLNAVESFIPVARIADMLLHPGEPFDYNGQRLDYPDARLVYWAGGNPFHHHQDLNRLRRAFARPDTIVVHEPYFTAMARHADFVLPATTSLEREDFGAGNNDRYLIAMHRALDPYGEARDDYAIFRELAGRLGVEPAFSEGRSPREWLEHLYERWRMQLVERDVRVPAFAEFWANGDVELPVSSDDHTLFDRFRADPDGRRLATPSGRIEIFSERVDGFGYDDCPGHPAWLEPEEWLGGPRAKQFPLHLIANQPSTRLHSQLDAGDHSRASKIRGREPIRIHPIDAAARGIRDGDIVRVWSDRGACLAGAVLSEDVRPSVVQLSTGAWFDPEDPHTPGSLCVHGNPNTVTVDRGTSRLAQGSTGQHALVELERFDGELPPIRAFDPPGLVTAAL